MKTSAEPDNSVGIRSVAPSRYGTVAIFLHWSIAVMIGWNLVLGYEMGRAKGLDQFNLFQLHKSVGIAVLLLSLGRLLWRLAHRPPALPATMSDWERWLAGLAHAALYFFMVGMPLTGWAVVSTSALNIPTLIFHTVPWPHLSVLHDLSATAKANANIGFGTAHLFLAWGGGTLMALHVAGALKHAFFKRDGLMRRMLPLVGWVHR